MYESILIPSVPGRWTIEGQGASPDDPTDAFRLRFSRGLTFQVDLRDPTPATDQMTLWNGFDFTGVPTVITSNLYLSGPYQASWDPRSTTAVPDASVALEFVNAGSYTVDITTSAPSFPRRV